MAYEKGARRPQDSQRRAPGGASLFLLLEDAVDDVVVPAIGVLDLAGMGLGGGIHRGQATRAGYLGDLPIGAQLIDAGDGDGPAGGDNGVAGVDEGWHPDLATLEQGHDGGGADLGLTVGGIGGLRHGTSNAGIANDMDAGHLLGLEAALIHRAETAVIRDLKAFDSFATQRGPPLFLR